MGWVGFFLLFILLGIPCALSRSGEKEGDKKLLGVKTRNSQLVEWRSGDLGIWLCQDGTVCPRVEFCDG